MRRSRLYVDIGVSVVWGLGTKSQMRTNHASSCGFRTGGWMPSHSQHLSLLMQLSFSQCSVSHVSLINIVRVPTIYTYLKTALDRNLYICTSSLGGRWDAVDVG